MMNNTEHNKVLEIYRNGELDKRYYYKALSKKALTATGRLAYRVIEETLDGLDKFVQSGQHR